MFWENWFTCLTKENYLYSYNHLFTCPFLKKVCMCTRQLMYENNTLEDNNARLMDDTITLAGVILQISLFVSITHT